MLLNLRNSMKVFLLGLPSSGCSTIAKILSEEWGAHYIHSFEWLQKTFRDKGEESHEDYRLELFNYVSQRLKVKPYLIVDNVFDIIDVSPKEIFIIDGINSPKDFMHLFDYNNDVVIFLNRNNGPDYVEGFDQIGINVMRDFCLFLASRNLLDKERWLEFNFPIPGNKEDDFVKHLGQKNSVTITRSIDKTIEILKVKPWNTKS